MLNFHDVSLTSFARQDSKSHTLDLPDGNRTTDQALITFAREVASAAAAVNGLASLDELRSLRSLRR